MVFKNPIIILSTVFFCFFSFSCDRETNNNIFYDDEFRTISIYIEDNKESYNHFYEIMNSSGLNGPLSAYNPNGNGYTLFLPTDEAFDRFIQNNNDYNDFNELLKDIDFIWELGRYHLVNSAIRTNEFPFGALPDTTVTGDFLTIGFTTNLDTTIYKVNNLAPVIEANIELTNGYVHVISEVIEPIVYTSYEWLEQNNDFSILADAFKITSLIDTMGNYRYTDKNQMVRNRYTVLAEPDTIFNKYGINSIDDLINKYATPGLDPSDVNNGLFQFTAYHLLEGSYFLDEFTNQNYNTYANYPVSINSSMEIRINQGVDTFGIQISGNDTILINYIRLFMMNSNIPTENGAIHLLTDVMSLFKPQRSERYFQFMEEPIIYSSSIQPKSYEFFDQEEFEVISWTGPRSIIYVKSSSTSELASNQDYLRIEGNFTLNYKIPRFFPGNIKYPCVHMPIIQITQPFRSI